MSDFDIVKSNRELKVDNTKNPEIVSRSSIDKNVETIVNAAASNFGTILDITRDIVQIQAMKTQSENTIRELNAKGDLLLKETEAYIKRKREDTDSTIKKAEIIRCMMLDFYKEAPSNLSSEEFSAIIIKFIDKIDSM